MDWLEIFKVGTHTDSGGGTREWTDNDLQEIASLYNPAVHEAPVVIGHPETDSPAYGWVESLKAEGGKLLAKLKDVAPEFVDWVKRGLYKKVSIALYPDLGLRHIGFLGAIPPAIKGLANVRFQERGKVTICFSDFNYKEVFEMSSTEKDPGKEIQRRVGEVMRNPRFYVDKRGNRFSEDITYSQALTFVQEDDAELAAAYAEILRPTKLTESEKKSLAAGQRIVSLINEKMKADKSLSYSEALTQVQKDNRNLILEYIGKK